MAYYAEIVKPDGSLHSRARSTVSHQAAIFNARRQLKHHAARRGAVITAGTPLWLSGCLLWSFTQGFQLEDGVWHTRANESMEE